MDRTPPAHPIRLVTAAALFDGHDAAINVIRRLLQAAGAEVVHLGHNRSAEEVARAAIAEAAQGVAVSSYQGGHMEYFRYLRALLDERGGRHVRIFGGGGGVIVPREIKALEAEGIDRVFSPEDGRRLGLNGMIDEILARCDFSPVARAGVAASDLEALSPARPDLVALAIRLAEGGGREGHPELLAALGGLLERRATTRPAAPVLGITGPGGAGKSSLTDELVLRFLADHPDQNVALLAVDPTKRKTGGALLGDRIRVNSTRAKNVYMRSLATRGARSELAPALGEAVRICQAAGFDLIVVETAGIGQSDAEVASLASTTLYVMTPEYGAATQLEKIEMLDHANFVAINKFDRRGAEDALRDVTRQLRRSRGEALVPVFGTTASEFNDPGVTRLYRALATHLGLSPRAAAPLPDPGPRAPLIAPRYARYLSEIAEACRTHRAEVERSAEHARRAMAYHVVLSDRGPAPAPATPSGAADPLAEGYDRELGAIAPELRAGLATWPATRERYAKDHLSFGVRGNALEVPLVERSLSGSRIPKVALPPFRDWGEIVRFLGTENLPGDFPYTAGVFPLKRTAETPARMFAGEGPPERTNARFHLLARGQPSIRLSTAFDSVTLYGEDPDERPDIFGKIGESGVSVATVEDAEKLYAGFHLADPKTSVSMTINGPAPIVLAFYMNAAIRQEARRHLVKTGRLALSDAEILRPDAERGETWATVRQRLSAEELAKIADDTLAKVRGTVQADILKEDQAQNTCIFSTPFALRLMGDIQAYFIEKNVRNYYSVSVSGYHIAEAGANPISQLAFTLANGFTYVAAYASRGMNIDDFAPNLSFFFSNGLDPEYTVIGRVARRIWAVAMKRRFGAGERAQKLKYHIQTSGRSLHAMEIDFNDIRTTLQALLALEDNCNSLHTNAYDEALTTPTDASVRRALAIQMIIDREFGRAKNENPLQGSFFVEALTDLVEARVLEMFDRLTERGGVLGAMETQFQRSTIQEESLEYERKKHDGTLPIVGVNTFQNPDADYERDADKVELRRASVEEKRRCIANLRDFWGRHEATRGPAITRLKEVARGGGNVFAELMSTVEHASLGQISHALYEIGGEFRRNM